MTVSALNGILRPSLQLLTDGSVEVPAVPSLRLFYNIMLRRVEIDEAILLHCLQSQRQASETLGEPGIVVLLYPPHAISSCLYVTPTSNS